MATCRGAHQQGILTTRVADGPCLDAGVRTLSIHRGRCQVKSQPSGWDWEDQTQAGEQQRQPPYQTLSVAGPGIPYVQPEVVSTESHSVTCPNTSDSQRHEPCEAVMCHDMLLQSGLESCGAALSRCRGSSNISPLSSSRTIRSQTLLPQTSGWGGGPEWGINSACPAVIDSFHAGCSSLHMLKFRHATCFDSPVHGDAAICCASDPPVIPIVRCSVGWPVCECSSSLQLWECLGLEHVNHERSVPCNEGRGW